MENVDIQQWQLWLKSLIPLSTFIRQRLGKCEPKKPSNIFFSEAMRPRANIIFANLKVFITTMLQMTFGYNWQNVSEKVILINNHFSHYNFMRPLGCHDKDENNRLVQILQICPPPPPPPPPPNSFTDFGKEVV